ncbi:MAG: hypothetical protein AUH41_08875 [Gemmatimonadetes bacterium 13_1_40CM_66_11]|nr:MAG: hypothetical protein AUH41_08875 [Gemmatimonadetes bacterium 13_1_40CM_66_11]
MRCLVVDDEPRLRRVLVRLLEGEGFACAEAGSGVEALRELEKGAVPLVISDLRMPEMDGVTLLREITTRWPETAVIVVTAVAEVESAVACLQMGALDYVAKPFHLDEVRARVSQALDKRRLIIENRNYQQGLEERVEAQARRIEELFLEGVHALVFALEAKDAYTRGHSMRVANYSVEIARALGLDKDLIDTIALGAELHDVGKIGVSESVLHKAGKLTDAEYHHIMEHTVIGARILGPLMRDAPGALSIVRSHHERLDGTGSPDSLKGDQIPFEARLVSVADAFDAMTSVRPYRPSLPVKHAMRELEEGQGVQFDAEIVKAFLRAFAEGTSLPIPTPQLQPSSKTRRARPVHQTLEQDRGNSPIRGVVPMTRKPSQLAIMTAWYYVPNPVVYWCFRLPRVLPPTARLWPKHSEVRAHLPAPISWCAPRSRSSPTSPRDVVGGPWPTFGAFC